MCYGWLLSNFCKIKEKAKSHWSDREAEGGRFRSLLSPKHISFFTIVFTLLLIQGLCQSPSFCLDSFFIFKHTWIHCQTRMPSKWILQNKTITILSSVGMWTRISAVPHWALKGLSRKCMFWLNSSHFKNSCGDKRWAEQRGTMPGRTSKTSKKDTTAGILQRPTNRTANVSTGNNNSMDLTDFCPMLLCPVHFLSGTATDNIY